MSLDAVLTCDGVDGEGTYDDECESRYAWGFRSFADAWRAAAELGWVRWGRGLHRCPACVELHRALGLTR